MISSSNNKAATRSRANPNIGSFDRNETPLHLAICERNKEMVRIILANSRLPVNINQALNSGLTAVGLAASFGDMELLKCFVSHQGFSLQRLFDDGIKAEDKTSCLMALVLQDTHQLSVVRITYNSRFAEQFKSHNTEGSCPNRKILACSQLIKHGDANPIDTLREYHNIVIIHKIHKNPLERFTTLSCDIHERIYTFLLPELLVKTAFEKFRDDNLPTQRKSACQQIGCSIL